MRIEGVPAGARLAPALMLLVLLAGFVERGLAQTTTPAAAVAAPAAPATLSPAERARFEALITQLENEEQRNQLIARMRALLQVQDPAPAAPTGALGDLGRLLFGAIAGDLTGRLDQMLISVRPLAVIERLADWIRRLFVEPAERAHLLEFVWKLLAILAAGVAAELVLRFLLRGVTRQVMARPMAGPGARLLRLVVGLALIALPLAAFAFAASIVGSVVAAKPLTAVAVGYIVSAYLFVRLISGVTNLVLSPDGEFPSLLRISQENAAYLNVWITRFAVIGVYGAYALEAARPLGMPFIVYESLVRILGLALVTLATIVILQNREAVARWIDTHHDADDTAQAAPEPEADGMGRLLVAVRGYLAAVWHVLAIAYLLLGYIVWAFAVDGGGAFLLRATLLTLGILVFAKIATTLQHRGVSRLFRVSNELAARYPLLELRSNRYLSVLRGLIDVVILLVALSAILEAWGLRGFSWLTTEIGRAATTRIVALGFFIGGAMLAWEIANAVIEHRLRQLDGPLGVGPRSQRLRTFLPLLRNVIFIFIVGVAGLLVLSELGVNIAPLLAGAGVIGLAIGFGSQTLVKDVITGLFILFEDTVNVGDVVDLEGGHSGVVESLSIRSIRLRDVTGAQHTIPFSQVNTIKNMTKDYAYYVFDLGVGFDTDLQKVVAVLEQVDAEARNEPQIGRDIVAPIEVMGLERFGDSALLVRARVKTWPGKQWRIGRIYNERIKRAFDRAGIEIPYPHQVSIQKRAGPARAAKPAAEADARPAPG